MKTIVIPVDFRNNTPSVSTEMKSKFIGEFSWITEYIYLDEDGHEVLIEQTITVPWDVCKAIYKAMATQAAKECS